MRSTHPAPVVCRCLASVVVVLAIAISAQAQDRGATPRYAGRAVIEVLQDLNARGLRVVFSTVLVRPALRVATEPAGPSLRETLDQVLRPHGLMAVPRRNGVLVVARAPRPHVAQERAPAPAGTLRGRVVDADTEAPLAAVLVVLQDSEQRTSTDGDGRFELTGLAPGTHHLYVSLVGYVLARPDVAIPREGVADVVVPLSAGAGAYTEQLTVHAAAGARPATSPTQFTVRSAELQELRGVLAEDPLRALQTMPGAATGDDFRSEFSVRGSAFRQMGFTLDGVPTPWLVHGVRAVEDTGTIAMLNADVLEEVTLSAGAGPQRFGNRTGAWVDTTMREGSRDAVRTTGSLSATGASVVTEGPLGRARRGAWLVSARQSYIDWLIRQLDRDETTTFGFSDAQAKIAFDVTPRQQLQLTTVVGRSTLHERDNAPSPNATEIGRSRTGLAIGSWRAAMGSSVLLTQRVAVAGVRYRNTNAFDQDLGEGRESAWTFRSEALVAPRPWVTLDGAFSVDRDWATVRDQQFSGVGSAPPVMRSWRTAELTRWREGGMVGARVTPSKTVTVDAGVRGDHERLFGHTTASPWLVARWTPVAQWTVSAGAGRAAQFPDLAQIAVGDPLTPLAAERARAVDISTEIRWGPDVTLQVSAFDRSETDGLWLDVPEPRLVAGLPAVPFASRRWDNRLAVSSRGVEVLVRRAAARGLTGWLSYAYGRTRNTDTVTGARSWGDFDQRHLLNLHASYRLSTRTQASARFRFGSNMPVVGYFGEGDGQLVLAPTRNDLRLPTYARLDLRVNRTYHFTKRRLTLFAEVLNVLNRENVGRTDGTVRSNATVTGFVETLFPILPSAGIRVEF